MTKIIKTVLSAKISHKDKEKIIQKSFELKQKTKNKKTKESARQNFINAF